MCNSDASYTRGLFYIDLVKRVLQVFSHQLCRLVPVCSLAGHQ